MRNRPANICFYISDYGYGHAARDIAIIRRILRDCNANIFVKSEGPHRFIEQSVPKATAIKTRNDIDLAYKKNSIVLDKAETEKRLDSWILSWDEYVSKEMAFCSDNNITLILSDIVPQAFIVADELGLPGIGIFNFTWHYIFFNIFGKTDATTDLENAYARGELALVLPFDEKMSLFKRRIPIVLVSRDSTMDRSALRKKYNISEDELLIYIGVGRSMDAALLREMKDPIHPGVKFLLSSSIDLPLKDAIKIPAEETETQNFIGMCDLAISKTGYSTVLEALRAGVPMPLFRREGFKGDCLIADGIKRLGIGDEISEPAFLDGGWIDKLDQMEEFRGKFEDLGDRFKRDGASEALGAIRDAVL